MKRLQFTLLFALIACTLVFSQTSLTLLKDMGKNKSIPSYPQDLTRVGNLLYFTADNDISGRELWVTDGSFAGTRMVVDATPGTDGSYPADFTAVNNLLYFTAAGALWVSDGTPQGVEKLVAESGVRILSSINNSVLFTTWPVPGERIYITDGTKAGTKRIDINGDILYNQISTIKFKDALYFTVITANSTALWKTDGTLQGTMRDFDLPGSARLAGATSGFMFLTANSPLAGRELWRTDGTQAGTVLIKDISPGYESTEFSKMTVFSDKLLFIGRQYGFDEELYVSDGTEAGTQIIKDIFSGRETPFSGPFRIDDVNNQVFFTASTEAGREVWRTDGTSGGTRIVRDIYPGPESSISSETSFLLNGHLFFPANDGVHGNELWKTDGTTTVMLKDGLIGDFSDFDVVENVVYFAGDESFWRSDGSNEGTTMIYLSGFRNIRSPRYVDGKIFFVGRKDYYDEELYVTDGTDAGTKQVKNIRISSNFSPFPIERSGELNGELIFIADGTVCKTNGTQAGTVILKEYAFGGFEPSYSSTIMPAGNTVVFSASGHPLGSVLWKSDGTPQGTMVLKDIHPTDSSEPFTIESLNGIAFFTAVTPEHGRELWRTDGTEPGTYLLKDFYTGPESGDLTWAGMQMTVKSSNLLFFFANTAEHGPALCRSDGTVSGTYVVKDIDPSTGYLEITFLSVMNDIAYFFCNDGVHGSELWRTDGTETGTYMVKDINPGPYSGSGGGRSFIRGNAFYFSAGENATGYELWKSDGTEAGTVRVVDLKPGSESSRAYPVALVGDMLIVSSYAGLWKIDEADGVTFLNNAVPEGSPGYAVNNKVFYVTSNTANGRELWVTDGTETGTHIVKDIREGAIGSNPDYFFVDGNYLYFTANDGESIQLWRTDGTICETKKLTNDPALIVSNLRKVGTHLVMWANSVDAGAELHSYSLATPVSTGCPTPQLITFNPIASKSYTDPDFSLDASVSSSLPLDISSSDPAVVHVENGIAQIKGAGVAYISVSQPGDFSNVPAKNVRQRIVVNKAPLTVKANSVSRIYGDTNPAMSLEYTGFKMGETQSVIDLLPEAVTTATTTSSVGQYPITLSASGDNNYDIVAQPAALTITPAPLLIKVNDTQRFYRAPNPSFLITYSGFKLSDNESVFSSPAIIETDATVNSPIGTYSLNISGVVAPNYNVSYSAGTLTINKALLKILADAKTVQYGYALPELTYRFDGLPFEEGLEALSSKPIIQTNASEGSGVGEYIITLGGGATSDNYDLSYESALLSITPKKLTVTVEPATKIYGEDNPPLTFYIVGFIAGEDVAALTNAPIVTTTATQFSSAGTYALIASGAVADNYSFDYVDASLQIQKKDLTATAENTIRKYGDLDPPFTIQYSGFINGDGPQDLQVAPQVTTVATTTSGVGQYSLAVSGGTDENYNVVAGTPGTLVIEKADQIITFAQASVLNQQHFTLLARSSADLAISYTSSGNIEMNQDQAQAVSPGIATVTASQTGNENFNAALPVTIEFCVIPATPLLSSNEYIITIDNAENDVLYQWYRNETLLEDASGLTYFVEKDGDYKVAGVAGECMSDFSEVIRYLVTSVKNPDPRVKIFPNPARSVLMIKAEIEPIKVSILSVNGTSQYEKFLIANQTLDVSGWARGVYIVKIQSSHGTQFQKLIIE